MFPDPVHPGVSHTVVINDQNDVWNGSARHEGQAHLGRDVRPHAGPGLSLPAGRRGDQSGLHEHVPVDPDAASAPRRVGVLPVRPGRPGAQHRAADPASDARRDAREDPRGGGRVLRARGRAREPDRPPAQPRGGRSTGGDQQGQSRDRRPAADRDDERGVRPRLPRVRAGHRRSGSPRVRRPPAASDLRVPVGRRLDGRHRTDRGHRRAHRRASSRSTRSSRSR